MRWRMAATINNQLTPMPAGQRGIWQVRELFKVLINTLYLTTYLEEHHITSFDAGSFFNLHDYDSSGEWTAEDILKTYGLRDESTNHISQLDKGKAVRKVIELYDRDVSGTVSFAEFVVGNAEGIELPDFGFGPGHHGDDEYEYEIHHFE